MLSDLGSREIQVHPAELRRVRAPGPLPVRGDRFLRRRHVFSRDLDGGRTLVRNQLSRAVLPPLPAKNERARIAKLTTHGYCDKKSVDAGVAQLARAYACQA